MSLGQLMVGVEGVALTDEERAMLRHPQVGGVILFKRNFQDVPQVAELTADIHSLRSPPLLIGVDQEGGRVQRFQGDFTRLPPAAVVGRAYDADQGEGERLSEDMGWLMAAELRAVGIDLSFAPVLDLDRGRSSVIGDRAFHATPEGVAALGRAWMRGMKAAGMSATGKHFPGHGAVEEDSHLRLPVDRRRRADILVEDVHPFSSLIRADLAAVMMAHVVYSDVDEVPASFSSAWIKDILRGELGFQGVVFGDDLGMEGAAGLGDFADRAAAGLGAGCDMVMLCNHPEAVPALLDRLGQTPDPVASMRLARLHGHAAPGWSDLRNSARWRAVRAEIDHLADSPWVEMDI